MPSLFYDDRINAALRKEHRLVLDLNGVDDTQQLFLLSVADEIGAQLLDGNLLRHSVAICPTIFLIEVFHLSLNAGN